MDLRRRRGSTFIRCTLFNMDDIMFSRLGLDIGSCYRVHCLLHLEGLIEKKRERNFG